MLYKIKYNLPVAPHGGAWIETVDKLWSFVQRSVAPHGGAWIETLDAILLRLILMSHPTGVRGLKQLLAVLPPV